MMRVSVWSMRAGRVCDVTGSLFAVAVSVSAGCWVGGWVTLLMRFGFHQLFFYFFAFPRKLS